MIHISDKAIQNFERAFGIAGLCILSWMIYRLGPSRIANNLHTVSWGFFLMVLSKGIRYILQTVSWKLILAQEQKKIAFWKLFKTILEGESLNYITITRMGGEPLKVYAIKNDVPLATAAASVIVLKFCTILGFCMTITIGFVAILIKADVTGEIKSKMGLGLISLALFLFMISWIQKIGMFRPLKWILSQFQSKREWIAKQVLRLTRLDNEILETYRSRPTRITLSALLNMLGWFEEIFFIWMAFHFLNMEDEWILITLIGTMSLLLNSFFFFVPWRAGTQEGTMVLTFTLLDLSEPVGLSLAILKRMRELLWVFVGLILFALESTPQETQNIPL